MKLGSLITAIPSSYRSVFPPQDVAPAASSKPARLSIILDTCRSTYSSAGERGQEFTVDKGANGYTLISTSSNNETISIRSFKLACRATLQVTATANIAGIIVYEVGTWNNKALKGTSIKPGWILLGDSDLLKEKEKQGTITGDNSQIHGLLINDYFGTSGTKLKQDYGVVFAGFAVMKGKLKFNSNSLNRFKDADTKHRRFKDSDKWMTENERDIVRGIIRYYIINGNKARKSKPDVKTIIDLGVDSRPYDIFDPKVENEDVNFSRN